MMPDTDGSGLAWVSGHDGKKGPSLELVNWSCGRAFAASPVFHRQLIARPRRHDRGPGLSS
jgi:hypothetical protein